MNKDTVYPTTGRIALLFMGWFLIIPLIWGIVLWKRQNEMNAQYEMDIGSKFQEKDTEIYERKLQIEEINKQVIDVKRQCEFTLQQREKEIGVQVLVERLQFLSVMKVKMEVIEKEAEDKKKAMETYIRNKEEEIHKRKEAIVQQEQASVTKIREEQAIVDAQVQKQQQLITRLEEVVEERKERVRSVFQRKHEKIEKLNQQIDELKREVMDLEDEALYQLVGLYQPRYEFASSEAYAKRLEEVRETQKHMVKNKTATIHIDNWVYENSRRKATAWNNQNIKFAIRFFNQECDSIIQKVKFNNIDVALKKMEKASEQTNQFNKYNKISINTDYLDLKTQELHLAYEYAQKKQEEVEDQRRIRELLNEERKAQKELEEELKKIRKEEQHLLNVLAEKEGELSETEKEKYIQRLQEIQQQIENVDYRVKNTKAGYVYIISNIGCFGEHVYKIGMTRRLDPLDRVRELGGASVPFHFDIHAIVFSEDAPALEASLHRAFQHRRVNKINQRKEFFKVDLQAIKKVIYEAHDKPVHFKMIAEAKEFRETQVLEQQEKEKQIV